MSEPEKRKKKPAPKTVVNDVLVKQLMIARGWTQQELATRARMSMGTLSRMLNNKPFLSSTLDRLAEALEVDPRDLQKPTGFPAPRLPAPHSNLAAANGAAAQAAVLAYA